MLRTEQELSRLEHFPTHELVARHMSSMTAEIAAAVKKNILEMQRTGQPPEKEKRIAIIDTTAANLMEQALSRMPFSVFSVGSEGGKEKHNGKLGVAMPTVLGRFGGGDGEVWMVNDPVEGTTAAAYNNPGAISVVAVTERNGIMATPDGIHYMEKLFVPPKAARKVSLDNSVAENLQVVCDAYSVHPEKVKVIILNRPRNQKYIEGAQSFGANVKLIEAGDLVPSLLSVLPPRKSLNGEIDEVNMYIGIGGWEEGMANLTALRAMGGDGAARTWTEEEGLGARLTLDDLVPGKKEHGHF